MIKRGDPSQAAGGEVPAPARRKSKYFLFVCTIVLLAITWLGVRWVIPMREQSDVAAFDIGVRGAVVAGLEVKQTADLRTLLIQTPRGYPTYAFDTRTRQLKQATPPAWEETLAAEPATSKSAFVGTDGRWLVSSNKHEEARRLVSGKRLVDICVSPTNDVVLALTTDGWKRPSLSGLLWPIGGQVGGGYTGQHYLEFFRLPELKPSRGRVRVPFTSAEGFFGPTWSADGAYVLFADAEGEELWIIRTAEQ